MNFDITQILLLINIFTLVGVLLVFVSLRSRTPSKQVSWDVEDLYHRLRDDIRFSVQPMSDIPLGVEEIVDLAVEIWRMEQRIMKAGTNLPDAHKKGLENSIQRMKKYLQKFDVEIQDYTGQKYNDGFNFDILSREQDVSLEYPVIKETVEPAIICRGRVVKRAKVILASNQK